MKRFSAFLSTFSLVEWIGRYPAVAGSILLLHVGLAGVAVLNTPSITPQPAAYFNQSSGGASGLTNNGLQSASGAFDVPLVSTSSWSVLFSGAVNSRLGYFTSNSESPFPGMVLTDNTTPGSPKFVFQHLVGGVAGTQWLESPGANPTFTSAGLSGTQSGYGSGFYVATPSGSNCARPPTAVWQGGTTTVQLSDPGFMCPVAPANLDPANIPGSGAQQSTGAGSIATTCASNSPVSGEMTVTTHVAVAHGVTPGQKYNLSSFTPSALNLTYTALPGTSGTTLVGAATISGGTCPSLSGLVEGKALSGTGTAITFPAISLTNPFAAGETGITTHNGQHFCGLITEYGTDSPTPGFQAISMVDEKGNPLNGAPALVTWPNQGNANATGYVVSGAQSSGNAALHITALNPYVIDSASYSAITGYVTFTMDASSGSPGFLPGSEFTVSGMNSTGASVNVPYIAVIGTTGLTVVGNPIAAVGGAPSPFASSPGTITAGGSAQLVSNIVPGMQVAGLAFNSYVLPFGSYSGSGTGGLGTYGINTNPTGGQTISVTSIANGPGSVTMVVGGSPSTLIVVGEAFTLPGYASPIVVTDVGTAHGLAGSYTVTNPNTSGSLASVTGTATGAIGSSGSPVNIFFAPQAIYSTTASSTALPGGTATARTQAQLGDFINLWGTNSTSEPAIQAGWGGELADIAMLYTPNGFPTQSGGAPSTAALASMCTKSTDIQDFATANGATVETLYRLNDTGTWGDSSNATITGYITNSGTNATLNVVSLVHGSLALPTGTETARLTGAGIQAATSATIPLTTSSASTYAITPNTTPAVGSIGSPVTFSVGRFAPMTPLTSSGSLTGYITTTSGVSTLHVTDLPNSVFVAKFTGTYDGAGHLTVNSTASGTVGNNMLISDNGSNLTGPPMLTKSASSPFTVAPNYYLAFASDSNMEGTYTALVPGSYVFNSSASPAITNPVKIVGYQGACGITGNAVYNGALGCYTLSGSPNASGAVGSSGSQVTLTATSIQDGGAVAPGPALTIRDQGPGIVFPVDQATISCSGISSCTGTGTLALSGTYDTGTLGGTPSGIQVLVSTSPNGAPLAGCTPCNWGALTATISAGKWSGTLAGVPGGGHYYVSVRAANGQNYATLPNFVGVGLPFAVWGNGIEQAITTGSVFNTVYFAGNWGFANPFSANAASNFLQGPPVAGTFTPAATVNYSGDRYGLLGAAQSPAQIPNEGIANFEQMLTTAFGWPTTVVNMARDGVGIESYTTGGATQTQTVGVGNGTLTTWCSSATFCPNTDHNEALTFNGASLTGGWFNGTITGAPGSPQLAINTWLGGALAPGMVLNTTGSPTLDHCLTGCTGTNSTSTWALAGTASNVSNVAMRADPPGGAPWPNFNLQQNGVAFGDSQDIKAGSFKISVNGAVVCQDSTTFAYNLTGGNCTGAGISAFVNYLTGDYEITFSSAPTGTITASWANITTSQGAPSQFNSPQNIDLFGDGTCDSGWVSAMFCKVPGGVIGQFNVNGSDADWINQFFQPQPGYPFGAVGYGQEQSGFFSSQFPAKIPGANASVPFFSIQYTRGEGPIAFTTASALRQIGTDQYSTDAAMKSTMTGTIASSVLTLSANAVGPMWEGEILGGAGLTGNGIYITGLTSGSWGVSGSTYALAGASGVSFTGALSNAVYYSGAGPAIYTGPNYDMFAGGQTSLATTTGYQPHTGGGFTGIRRVTARWAAEVWGGLTNLAGAVFPPNASPPTLSRAAQTACGGQPSPCFDTTNSYTTTVTITGGGGGSLSLTMPGLTAHQLPIVVGETVTCSGCAAGVVVTGVSVPPTQSSIAGQGQVGSANNGWTVSLSGPTGRGVQPYTFGCAPKACIDIAIQQNTTNGTYGTAWALDNCGANSINGSAPNYSSGTGRCVGEGLGGLVRGFRIGPTQAMYNRSTTPTGDVFDDGADLFGGAFTVGSAFTCNIVDTAIVRCVKGSGTWTAGSTFMSYGDPLVSSGRVASLLGYVGGQTFPFSGGGTGYPNSQTISASSCSPVASGAVLPKFTIVASGGVVTGVFPANASQAVGLGLGGACTVTPATGSGFNGTGSITIPLAPPEGVGGIATVSTDNNTMGMYIYDNSGEVGNPLNLFFTNGMGGYWEPGLPLRTFGEFQGAGVAG